MNRLYVSNKDESPRMFKNDILDVVSRTSWYVPLLFWLPILAICLYYTISHHHLTLLNSIVCLISALVFWSFTEYILHRFIFHYEPESELGKRIHFISHGVHHDFPNDSKRLVLPPSFSFLLSIPFYFLFYSLLGDYYLLFFVGFMFGYLFYDISHYALHHATWNNKYFKALKEHHMLHHYHDPSNGYGVTSPIWDRIFNTMLNTK